MNRDFSQIKSKSKYMVNYKYTSRVFLVSNWSKLFRLLAHMLRREPYMENNLVFTIFFHSRKYM